MARKKGFPKHLDEFAEGQPGVVADEDSHEDILTRIEQLRTNVESRNGQINAMFEIGQWLALVAASSSVAGPYGPAIAGIATVAIPMFQKIVNSIRTGNRVELIPPEEFGGFLDSVIRQLREAKGE